MADTLESITYLIKVQQAILINNQECCYDEIIAQCTNLDKAVNLANSMNGKIEKHRQVIINNAYEDPLEQYSY